MDSALTGAATESTVNRLNAIADCEPFQFGNGSKIGTLSCAYPIGPCFIFLAWAGWNFQFNELRSNRFVANRGKKRSGFAVCQ